MIVEDDDLRELTVKTLRESLRVVRLEVHGRQRVSNMLKAGVTTARAQERKLRAAAKRDINVVVERSPRGAIESVVVGTGDDIDVLTDPVDVTVQSAAIYLQDARAPCNQRKWFRSLRKYGASERPHGLGCHGQTDTARACREN